MATKRCFNQKITESDAFLEMPLSTQCLYFHLNMYADDDGFVNSPKKVQKMLGATDDDMNVLIAKSFVLRFDTGIIVIKHWRIHNTLQNDRYKHTTYIDEYAQIEQKDNKAYTWKQNGNILETQPNITKPNITKNNIYMSFGTYQNVKLTNDQYEKLKKEFPNNYEEWIEKADLYCQSTGKKYKDYLATIRNWSKKERNKPNKKSAEMPEIDF